MKTANPKIQIFKTFEQAKKYFDKLTVPAIFVQGRGFVTDYFVEITTKGEETCIECWPTKYDLIDNNSYIFESDQAFKEESFKQSI